MLTFAVDPPAEKQIKKKALIVIKARPETKEAGFPSGVANEVVFMELTKPILENLYNTCQVRDSPPLQAAPQSPYDRCHVCAPLVLLGRGI